VSPFLVVAQKCFLRKNLIASRAYWIEKINVFRIDLCVQNRIQDSKEGPADDQ
jgi:hypothetical protein